MNTGLNDGIKPELGIMKTEPDVNSGLKSELITQLKTENNQEFTEITDTPLKIPSKIYNKLFPHQKSGIPWLHNTLHNGPYQGGILADDMGCGKSALVATYLLSLFTTANSENPRNSHNPQNIQNPQHTPTHPNPPKILIVAPNSITDNWRIELGNWAPGVQVYDCSSRVNTNTRLNNILNCFAFGGICITNYENVAGRTKFNPETGDNYLQYKWLSKDHATTLQKHIIREQNANPGRESSPTEITRVLPGTNEQSSFGLDLQKGLEWDYLILDEAHQIRNVNNRSNRVKQVNATYRLAMTGTPIQNRMSDYFNILDWVTHSRMFSTKKEFEENYGKPIETAREKGEKSNREFQRAVQKGQKAAERLKELVDPIKLQRSKFELKLMNGVKKTDIVVHCFTSDYQQELYKRVLNDENLQDIIDEGTKRCMLTYLTHLKAICDSPVLSKIAYKDEKDNNNNTNTVKNVLKREFFGSPSFDSPSPAKSGKSENSTDIYTDLPSTTDSSTASHTASCTVSCTSSTTSNTLKIADSGKLEFITNLLKLQTQEEVINNLRSKTLIFSRSKKILSIIQKYLEEELGYQKDRDFMRLDGDVQEWV